MENIELTKKPLTPPYLSVSKIEETFKLVSNRNFKTVSASDFEGYKFGKADALLAFNMLRFLAIVDENGTPTEFMPKIRLIGDSRKKEFETIVRSAYDKLFDRVNAPQELSTEEMMNEFTSLYGLSHRIARSATPAFIKLCEYAGLKEEGSIVGRKRTPKTSGEKLVVKPKINETTPKPPMQNLHAHVEDGSKLALVRVVEGRMALGMPFELKERLLDEEELGADWTILRKAIKVFADKHIPVVPETKTSDSKESEVT